MGLLGVLAEFAAAQSPVPPWQLTPAYGNQGVYARRPHGVRATDLAVPVADEMAVEGSTGELMDAAEPAYATEGAACQVDQGQTVVQEYGCDSQGANACTVGPCSEIYGLQGRLWFRADYLMWWTKGAHVAPLASTGTLDTPGVEILFGGNEVDPGVREGGRFTLTYWTCPMQDAGIEASYLFLGRKSVNYSNSNTGSSILARPFLNADSGSALFGMQDAQYIAQPGNLSGRLDIQTGNELNVVDLVVRHAMIQQCDLRVDLLAGYRYARFAENLSIDSRSVVLPGSPYPAPTGTIINRSDLFTSGNDFNGAEIGISAQRRGFRWSWDAYAKLALGGTRSRVNVGGESSTSLSSAITPGALLAQPSNIGVYQEGSFTMLPEIGLNLSYDVTSRLKARFGYSMLYWSKIARPSDQIDLMVNRDQPGGLPSPQFRFVTNDFWAQGLNVGLDYSY